MITELTPSMQLAYASHRRHSGVAAAAHDEADMLTKLAELLGSPAAVKKAIGEYGQAVAAAKAEQVKLEKLRAAVADERARHDDKIAREVVAHTKAMEKAHAELAAVKKEAAQLKAQADADRAHAAKLRQDVERRYSQFMA